MAATDRVFRWLGSLVSSRADRGSMPRHLSARIPAVPAKGTPAKALLHVYRGIGGRWYVRREGIARAITAPEAAFAARLPAIEFARLLGMAAGSYRILFETTDGSVLEERFIPR